VSEVAPDIHRLSEPLDRREVPAFLDESAVARWRLAAFEQVL
jgi:hypothetical protein